LPQSSRKVRNRTPRSVGKPYCMAVRVLPHEALVGTRTDGFAGETSDGIALRMIATVIDCRLNLLCEPISSD
jgi:hypothetical protein